MVRETLDANAAHVILDVLNTSTFDHIDVQAPRMR
jgi:hypothetical protein